MPARLLLPAVLLTGLTLLPRSAQAEGTKNCGGFAVPSSAKKTGDNPEECRFISTEKWEDTLKSLERNAASPHKWHREVNIPQAKYVHMESSSPKTAWEGVNVYQLSGGDAGPEVRIYVIPRPVTKTDVKDKDSKKGKGKSKKDR